MLYIYIVIQLYRRTGVCCVLGGISRNQRGAGEFRNILNNVTYLKSPTPTGHQRGAGQVKLGGLLSVAADLHDTPPFKRGQPNRGY